MVEKMERSARKSVKRNLKFGLAKKLGRLSFETLHPLWLIDLYKYGNYEVVNGCSTEYQTWMTGYSLVEGLKPILQLCWSQNRAGGYPIQYTTAQVKLAVRRLGHDLGKSQDLALVVDLIYRTRVELLQPWLARLTIILV